MGDDNDPPSFEFTFDANGDVVKSRKRDATHGRRVSSQQQLLEEAEERRRVSRRNDTLRKSILNATPR